MNDEEARAVRSSSHPTAPTEPASKPPAPPDSDASSPSVWKPRVSSPQNPHRPPEQTRTVLELDADKA
ncbi:hypothetical protein ACIP42_47770, partial [Streptomyces sp. NPDC088847]